jgi:Helicase associated domain
VDWETRFDQLVNWKRVHGHANVPFDIEGGLGWWNNTQRQRFRKGNLRMDRREKLDRINFDWNPIRKRRDNISINKARIHRRGNDGGKRGGIVALLSET